MTVTPGRSDDGYHRAGRSPLTVAEGIAVVTPIPGILRNRNCFSLLGSHCGDRRVTAVWVGQKPLKSGWCWTGNPLTWLGSASYERRLAAVPGDAERLAG